MKDLIQRFFGAPKTHAPPSEHDARIATCALFVEIASIDQEFSAVEVDHILAQLQARYGLAAEDAALLLSEAKAEVARSIDLWQFTRLINEHYSTEEKLDIVEMLWQLVYADGHLDAHERYLMGKLTGLLNLEHSHVIERKLRARGGPVSEG